MLLDVEQSLTRSQYLGCLHAFIGQFQTEIYMLRSLAIRLRGHTRQEVFGWAASLDETRYRASLMLDRWRYFNETASERVLESATETAQFSPDPTIDHESHVCAELMDMLSRTNMFIDSLEDFSPDDVRMIGEMVEALDREIQQDREHISRIALELEEAAGVTVTPDDETGLLMIDEPTAIANSAQQFAEAREQFAEHLRTGC
ncbi:MAG: hypothetical protein HOH43_13460 [Candidatus Latescibacteria bacterium]|nr:hypothetical protein [Candidatus Latescibacterota bacterium]